MNSTNKNILILIIVLFYSQGRTGSMAAMPNSPGLAISVAGNVYLASCYGMSLEVYNSYDDVILQSDIRPIAGEKTRPIDIALDNNRIYVADNQYNNVIVYKYDEHF